MASAFDIPTEPSSKLHTVAIVVIFIFPALALLIVVLRAIGRVATRQFGLDDWLISIAMILSILETLMSYFFIKTTFVGIQPQFIPEHDPEPGRIWGYAVQILYNPILALIKASILVFLLKLFGQKDFIRRCIYALATVNVMQAIGVLFAVVFQCHPIAFTWNLEIRGGTCINRRVLFTGMSAFNIVMDLLILALPLWIFSGLRIPGKTKAALLVVFLLGFLVTITSVVRLAVLVQDLFELPGSNGRLGLGFVTWAIETNLALITASAPALRPLLRGKSRYRLEDAETGMGEDKRTSDDGRPWRARSVQGGNKGRRGGRKEGGGGGGGGQGSSSRRGRSVQSRDMMRVIGIEGRTPGLDLNPDLGLVLDRELALEWDKETELRRGSPGRSVRGKIMTSANAATMRLSDVQREIDVLVKDLAIGPDGSYSLHRPTSYEERERDQQVRREREQLEREVKSRQRAAASRKPPSDTSSHAAVVPNTASRQPGPRETRETRETRTNNRPRGDRDFSEERKSKYGDKRNGVITPREPSEPSSISLACLSDF